MPTETTMVEDRGIPFVIHITTLQDRKRRAEPDMSTQPQPVSSAGSRTPHRRRRPRHLSVLNKFNVLDHHLLIVTREFEPQETLLTLDDFEALLVHG